MADFAWWCDLCTETLGRPVAPADCAGHGYDETDPEGVSGSTGGTPDPEFAAKLRSTQFLLPGPFRAVRGKTDG